MERIQVRPMGPREYAVVLTEGGDTTHHRVVLPESLLDDLGLIDADDGERLRLVHESITFLLDREPGDAVPKDLDLDDLAGRFSDYVPELLARLGR